MREALRAVSAVAALVALSLCLASVAASQGAMSAGAPSGNAQGLALLGRVHAAYLHVPAVQAGAQLGLERVRFTLLLRNGVATAEEFFGTGPAGTTVLVQRGSGPTYAHEPGAACWRPLAPGNSQSLEDVGLRFPDAYRMLVRAPRRSGNSWLLTAVTQGRDPTNTAVVIMHISVTTLLLESETVTASGHSATEHVHALTRQPALATPTPAC